MTSFQAFACIASVVVLMDSVFSVLLKERLFNTKIVIMVSLDNVVQRN